MRAELLNLHVLARLQNSNKLTPLPGAGRQHLEVNGQGSSTSVKQMACNGLQRVLPSKRPARPVIRANDASGMRKGRRMLVDNAQGMEKGSLDTRISTL